MLTVPERISELPPQGLDNDHSTSASAAVNEIHLPPKPVDQLGVLTSDKMRFYSQAWDANWEWAAEFWTRLSPSEKREFRKVIDIYDSDATDCRVTGHTAGRRLRSGHCHPLYSVGARNAWGRRGMEGKKMLRAFVHRFPGEDIWNRDWYRPGTVPRLTQEDDNAWEEEINQVSAPTSPIQDAVSLAPALPPAASPPIQDAVPSAPAPAQAASSPIQDLVPGPVSPAPATPTPISPTASCYSAFGVSRRSPASRQPLLTSQRPRTPSATTRTTAKKAARPRGQAHRAPGAPLPGPDSHYRQAGPPLQDKGALANLEANVYRYLVICTGNSGRPARGG